MKHGKTISRRTSHLVKWGVGVKVKPGSELMLVSSNDIHSQQIAEHAIIHTLHDDFTGMGVGV